MKLNKSYVEFVGKMHSINKENSNETISFSVKSSTKKNVEKAIEHLEGSYDIERLVSCFLDDLAKNLMQLPKPRKPRKPKAKDLPKDDSNNKDKEPPKDDSNNNVVHPDFKKTGSGTP